MIWTRELLEQLKKALKDQPRTAVIFFEGQELLVAYARYLIEYLDAKLVPAPRVEKVTLDEILTNYEEALDES